MSDNTDDSPGEGKDSLNAFFDMQGKAFRDLMAPFVAANGGAEAHNGALSPAWDTAQDPDSNTAQDFKQWAECAQELQQIWLTFLSEQAAGTADKAATIDPAGWWVMAEAMSRHLPQSSLDASQQLASDTMGLWQSVFSNLAGQSRVAGEHAPDSLPKKDRRFADPAWREHPGFALLHQTYLMLAEYFKGTLKEIKGLDEGKKQQLEFALQSVIDAMSPDNFLATNPVVMKRTVETRGQNLVRGLRHLVRDLKRGQLTHTDPDAFTLGENLAASPGKVVHETALYQLIQYSPSTSQVLEVPLVIFPPWINRFYILDLTPKKSFIKWAVDQGLSVFVVSWKSADESMSEVVWDDYILAQIDAIDRVCARLKVAHAHTIGYCVAGTTLAASLAVMERTGTADKVKSATFFTAQVDFERSGDLKNFIDEGPLHMIEQISARQGYLDGRYLAATFNALRAKDLIWNYVVNNYLLGEDYPAFDLLHWNGDVTNLPARWHGAYLRDLYRDNKLVIPDALEAGGTPIDLTRVTVPSFVQAGREDHIAPAQSVWRITEHFKGPLTFLLAGSGHIAGVINPPAANKYQYWTGDSQAASLDEFIEGAKEHPGSWWPYWLDWLHQHGEARIAATGKRRPGGRGDTVIEDAPGRYVKTR